MNKPSKRDTSLCERDALADLYAQERALLYAYAKAAGEGERSLRAAYAALFAEAAEDAHTLYAALSERLEGERREEEGGRVERLRERFGQEQKKLKVCLPQN